MNSAYRIARVLLWIACLGLPARSLAGEQPVAIFHAFDQRYSDVTAYVCTLADQGYSHVQIAPAQRSKPDYHWWARYQPLDYAVIDGMGSEADLQALTKKARGCGLKVIADVVFNHMADVKDDESLSYPHVGPSSFHPRCTISYQDGNRDTELSCWLGASDPSPTSSFARGLPDLDQSKDEVWNAHRAHLRKLLELGVDGFRFDAAKHMPASAVQRYIDYVNGRRGGTWNYLEVIQDGDTSATDYNGVAAVTDFLLYHSLQAAFQFGGDLRALRVVTAVDDPRSVTFGRNHDNLREISDTAISPWGDRTDAYLATTFVLAREAGTPLILNWDNADSPIIRAGVKFRQIMRQRGASGGVVQESVLAVVDSPTLLVMERGAEGFYVVNKAVQEFDVAALDLTLTHLEGCYRELRNDFLVAVERRDDAKKWVTRWGTWNRGGMRVTGRDALFFVREPWSTCQLR